MISYQNNKTLEQASKKFEEILNSLSYDDAVKFLGDLGFLCLDACNTDTATDGSLIVDITDVFVYDENGEKQLVGGYSWKYFDGNNDEDKEPDKKYWSIFGM